MLKDLLVPICLVYNDMEDKEMIKNIRRLLVSSMSLLLCVSLNAIQLADFRVNPKTNDIKIKMATFDSKNNEQQTKNVLLESEIYREVEDEYGNLCWKKDDATYSYSSDIAYSVSQEKPYIIIPWICNDPVKPSKKFKIILKKRIQNKTDSNKINPNKVKSNKTTTDKIVFEKIFEVEKLNI